MLDLKTRFPVGVDYEIAYDTTPYIRESVKDVVKTLFEAVVLVALVVMIFLQSWRPTLIPLLAVPVAIVGTFAVMAVLGFSLNNISLLGLVLAISIVVDDAIVVVENVERWLENGLSPRDAARKAMEEVTSPVIAVALVLSAVFIPCAFISGITGQFFRQFAVTVSVSTVISAFNSLTLSPALSAVLLKKRGGSRDPLTWLLDTTLGWLFRLFDRSFSVSTELYTRLVGRLLRMSVLVLLVYAGLLGVTYWLFNVVPTCVHSPTGHGPADRQHSASRLGVGAMDAGRAGPCRAHLPQDAGRAAMWSAFRACRFYCPPTAATSVRCSWCLTRSRNARSPNSVRRASSSHLQREFAHQIPDAVVNVFNAAPVPGLGVAGGFKLMVEDRGSLGLRSLQQQTDAPGAKIKAVRGLVGVLSMFRSNVPQLFLDIDRSKASALGVALADINEALEVYLGSTYVNSFNAFGRFWQVNIMADGIFRNQVPDINLIKVRNSAGKMVPMGTVAAARDVTGPLMVIRYNLYNAAPINGNYFPGQVQGDPLVTIQELADQTLPRSTKTEWTELTFMQLKEVRDGNTAIRVFGLSVVFVFLALAALYESWSLPLAVILVVPTCLLCSTAGVAMAHKSIDIFVQIGLVVLVGLACKNAILIIEFADN